MFRRFMKKRLAVVGLVGVGALALAVGAYAYFTSTGTSPASSASAGSASNYDVTLAPTGSVTLYPTVVGEPNFSSLYQPYSGVVTNQSTGHQQVSKLEADITGVTPIGSNTCAATNFILYSPSGAWTVASDGQSATTTDSTGEGTGTVYLPANLAGGDSFSYNDIAVYLSDSGSNQDGCQGATVSLTVTAS